MNLIAGILRLDGKPVERRRLLGLAETYAEQGPDSCGVWAHGAVGLVHWNRTSTLEPQHETLPLATLAGPSAVTANARIDNRDELFQHLHVARREQVDLTDAELILRSYQKWGSACVERLEGDFSFAVYDGVLRRIVCAQSCFPPSPLYFVRRPDCFAFASRITPLLAISGAAKRLNERALAAALSCAEYRQDASLETPPETMFVGVETLPPANTITIDMNGRARIARYWEPDANCELNLSTDDDYYAGLRELVVRAVHDRLRSHHPVGCFLSGGLDSSSIACIAARAYRSAGQRLTAISSILPTDYVGSEKDERRFIEIVKQREDLDVEYVYPRGGFTDDLAPYMNYFERPVTVFQHYVYRAFYEAARARRATVVLDGVGGEAGPSFAGNEVYGQLARQRKYWTLYKELTARARETGQSPSRGFLRHTMEAHLPGLVSLFRRMSGRNGRVVPIALALREDFAHAHGANNGLDLNDHPQSGSVDLKRTLCSVAASYQQQMPMLHSSQAYGVRTWYPFLDRRIVDYCLAAPARVFCANGWQRNFIRRAMEGVLPSEIQWRKCKAPLTPDFYRRFLAESAQIRELFAAVPADHVKRQLVWLSERQLDGMSFEHV